MFGFLLLIAIAFIAYAMFTQFKNTDPDKPVPARVWAAVTAAGAAIGAAVMPWIQSVLNQ